MAAAKKKPGKKAAARKATPSSGSMTEAAAIFGLLSRANRAWDYP